MEQFIGSSNLIEEAMRYSALAESKMIRAALVCASGKVNNNIIKSISVYYLLHYIAATNKNLSELVKNNQFRQDLYFRLKTVNIHIPALRERVEDIGPFIERFALEFTRSNDIAYRGFMPDAVRIMKQYEWPGNVRELKHFVEKVLVLERGERITAQMVEKELMDLMAEDNISVLSIQIKQQPDPYLTISDAFIDDARVSPNRKTDLAKAFLFSTFIAFLIAYFRERKLNKIYELLGYISTVSYTHLTLPTNREV